MGLLTYKAVRDDILDIISHIVPIQSGIKESGISLLNASMRLQRSAVDHQDQHLAQL